MKKIFLSTALVLTFIIYSLSQKMDDQEITAVAPLSTNHVSKDKTASLSYKDGQYTGDIVDAYYGNVQVKVTINSGKITDVRFLKYPNDRHTSEMINSQAMPRLISETIKSQIAEVDIITGATQTSRGFQKSLKSALDQAKS